MKKNYTIKDFTDEYESKISAQDKETFLKTKLKVEKYMPYSDKLTVADNIIKSSSYALAKNEEGKLYKTDKISVNSPMRYILFVMTVVNKYTNLEVNFQDVMPEFDCLNKNCLVEYIFNRIGDKEISEFNTVLEMVLNDFLTNEYQFKNYINDIVYKIGGMAQHLSPVLNNIVDKIGELPEEERTNLFDKLSKLGRFIK